MAERNIGLRLQLNGVNIAIKSVKDLEKELKLAKEDLKELGEGSIFSSQLSGEIANAEKELKKLNQTSKGLSFEKQLQGIGQFAGGITASFAAATAAVQLFGGETEDVSKAAAQAQNALTIAIGAKGIAEAIAGARIIATTVATKAQTVATNLATISLRTLFATISANPWGALATAIALAVVAIIAFNSQSEKTITIQDEFNEKLKEGQKPIREREVDLRALQAIINDNTQSEKIRIQALNDLKKVLPGLKNLTLENKDATDLINRAIEDNIELVRLQTETDILRTIATEKATIANQVNSESLDEQLSFLEKVQAVLLKGGTVGPQQEAQRRLTEKQTIANQAATEANNKLVASLRLLTLRQAEAAFEAKKLADADKAAEERKNARLFLLEREIRLVDEQIKLRQELIKVFDATAPEPEIIKRLTDQLNIVLGSIQATRSEFTKLFDEDFKTKFKNDLQSVGNILEEEIDDFGELFLRLRKDVSDELLSQNVNFKEALTNSFNILSNEFKDTNKVAFDAGAAILRNYELLQNEIDKQPPLFQKALDINKFLTYLKDFKIGSGDLVNDFDLTTGKITKSQLTVARTFTEASDNYENYVKNLIAQNVIALESDERYVKRLREGKEQITKTNVNLQIREQKIRDFEKQVEQERITEATNRVQNIINASNAIIKTEQEIINFNKKAVETREELQKNSSAFIQSLFVNESERIIQIADIELKRRKGFIANLKKEVEDFSTFREREEKRLSELFPEFEKLSAEERLKILEAYYEKVKQLREKNTEDEKKSNAQISQSIAETLQNLTRTLQLGVEVFATSLELSLNKVNKAEEKQIAELIGNEEEKAEKRIEIEKIYEAKRKEITKKGQIAQLQLSRVQALANVAEAVTKALTAGPIIGQILAGVSAALGLAQVVVISQQIGQVSSLQSGGIVRGPSHTQGGVSFARGGVELEGNESVINRRSTLNFAPLLDTINQSGGGRPIRIESAMDSRLIEVLATQKTQPIRAYVIEQDITKSQAINRRLEELASF
jgi:hypothetical protein